MILTIHRGAREIGGSCVEVAQGGTRLVVDIGLPLFQDHNPKKDFDRSVLRKKPVELVDSGILPPVPGLWRGGPAGPPVAGVLISHSHQDHHGLLSFLRDDVPVYLSEGTLRVLEVGRIFLPRQSRKARVQDPVILEAGRDRKIGDFTVTSHAVDHSAFDSQAFVIQGGGKSILYSGDLRDHGRKPGMLPRLLRNAPRRLDAMLLEGTRVDSGSGGDRTSEYDVEEKLVEIRRRAKGLVLVTASTQNIDRIVSLCKAAQRTRSLLVVDLYAAYLLDRLCDLGARLPRPRGHRALRVFFARDQVQKLKRWGQDKFLAQCAPCRIREGEIGATPGKIIWFIRTSEIFLPHIVKTGNLDGAVLVYSMWEGYLERENFRPFAAFLKRHGIPLQKVHSSGHATLSALQRIARTLAPRHLIPIHTFAGNEYPRHFSNVTILEDGQPLNLS